MTELPAAADVVVIGAGHNALVCAGYLAAAGLEVAVLEAREVIGGDTVTEALTLPGFAHDSCSSAHVLIQANPLLRDDELGLLSSYGLRYVHTDPAVVLPQPGGDALVVHRDLDATAEEISRWSPDDADALRALMGEWDGGLAAAHGRFGSGLPLGDDLTARRYDALRRRSAWDVITERFTHPVVRNLMTWLSFATIQSPFRPGTGALPSAITSGRLRYGWATPVGGSGALPEALRRLVEARGGAVVTGAPVTAIEVTSGRATAVRTAAGRVVARRAVVSSAHLAGLGALLDPRTEAADLAEAAATWRPGLSLFAVHAALRRDIAFTGATGPVTSVAGGLGTSDGLRDQLAAFDRGEPDARDPWLLVVASTVVDPDRAPDGGGTLKLLTVAPWELADGRDWSDRKQEYAAELLDLVRARSTGLDPADVLALEAESPADLATRNPHNVGGSCHGGEFVAPDGVVRPGWRSYRSSVDGLFLTGATTHPGGSVSGRPGRNTARVVLTDLGLDPSAVMGPA